MKSLKTNVYLALALAVIASFVYWFEFKKEPERKNAEENRKKLLAFDSNVEIQRLTVNFKEKDQTLAVDLSCRENCKFSESNSKWEIEKPFAFKADEGNVGAFIASLSNAVINETIPVEGDLEKELAKFGLSKEARAARLIQFQVKSKPEIKVYLGDESAMGDNVYAYVEGDPKIRMIASHIKNNLGKGLSYWRAKRLFGFAASQLEKFSITNSTGKIALSKKGPDWFLPANVQADNETIDTFLTGLVYMNATEFASDDKVKDRSRFNLMTKPKYRVELTVNASKEELEKNPKASSNEVVLEIYESILKKKTDKNVADTMPKMYAMISNKNFIVEIDRPSTEKFNKRAVDFKFKNLIPMNERGNIREISVIAPGKAELRFLSEAGQDWKLVKGAVPEFDPATVYETAQKIPNLKVTDFVVGNKLPKEAKETARYEVLNAKKQQIGAFTIYSVKTGDSVSDFYVKMKSGDIGKLEKTTAQAMPYEQKSFQKKKDGPGVENQEAKKLEDQKSFVPKVKPVNPAAKPLPK